MTTSIDDTNRSLLKIGGWSAIASGGFYILITVYIFGVLPQFGFSTDMFDDHTLLHPWVYEHARLYQIAWLFYFLTQLFLLPVPISLANYFGVDKSERTLALIKFGRVFCIVAITLAMLSAILFYASSPITARAYTGLYSMPESQALVLTISGLVTDIAKETRLFSEILLGIWLVSIGYLFSAARNASSLSWLSYGIGFWTLFVVIFKFFNPYAPLEDALGIFLGAAYLIIGIHQIRTLKAPLEQVEIMPDLQPDI